MKKLLIALCIISLAVLPATAQNTKADKEALALEKFENTIATIESKDFVILVDPAISLYLGYEGTIDVTHFLAYEKEHIILQGPIAGNALTLKLNVSDFGQVTDKKGNVKFSMNVLGFYHNGKIEISLKKTTGALADVIITTNKDNFNKRFMGEVVPRAESKYYKKPGEI